MEYLTSMKKEKAMQKNCDDEKQQNIDKTLKGFRALGKKEDLQSSNVTLTH